MTEQRSLPLAIQAYPESWQLLGIALKQACISSSQLEYRFPVPLGSACTDQRDIPSIHASSQHRAAAQWQRARAEHYLQDAAGASLRCQIVQRATRSRAGIQSTKINCRPAQGLSKGRQPPPVCMPSWSQAAASAPFLETVRICGWRFRAALDVVDYFGTRKIRQRTRWMQKGQADAHSQTVQLRSHLLRPLPSA